MSESERRSRWSWSIPPKEYPDLSHIKNWSNRLRAGEEAIFHNFRIAEQKPRIKTCLIFENRNGSGRIVARKGPHLGPQGRPHLDQVNDYYIAAIKSPKVEATIVNHGHLRTQIDTDDFAHRRSSYEFGEEFPSGGKTLLLPPTAKLIAVGAEQIQDWIDGSAYLQDVYAKLKQRLKSNMTEISVVA